MNVTLLTFSKPCGDRGRGQEFSLATIDTLTRREAEVGRVTQTGLHHRHLETPLSQGPAVIAHWGFLMVPELAVCPAYLAGEQSMN